MEAGVIPGRRPPATGGRLQAGEAFALAGLAFLLLVTPAWWALALWPPPASAPAWVQAARTICFGTHGTALPDAGGWILLVGEPLGMMAALWVIAGQSLPSALRWMAARRLGRALLSLVPVLLLTGAGLAAVRVRGGESRPLRYTTAPQPADWASPELGLRDHHGAVVSTEMLRGRPALVTFGYAHCETVCPLLVRDALGVGRGAGVPVVVVTLDPWRDTPSRLAPIAASWGLGEHDHLLGGAPPDVLAVLAAWHITPVRDARNGAVTHAPVTYVLDGKGRVRFATNGSRPQLMQALRRLKS